MKILLLSPYDALSHQYWREGLVEMLPGCEFTVVTLAARYFSWRFRGNSLTMAHDKRLKAHYDVVIATSMTDLSALKGMCPTIASVRSILYFHENQFAYPDAGNTAHIIERQMTSLYSAIAADFLVFNSAFNRRTFLDGIIVLLKKMPDGVPSGLPEQLEAKSEVNSVAIRAKERGHSTKSSRLSIVWNHRWEYDKGTQDLEQLVKSLLVTPIDFQMHVIGQSFRKIPAEIQSVCDALQSAGKLGVCGFVESRQEYLALLDSSHIVLSTARHEFQGVAILEATQAGCIPVVPDDLAYKEFIPESFRYSNHVDAIRLIDRIDKGIKSRTSPVVNLPQQVHWATVQQKWLTRLQELLMW